MSISIVPPVRYVSPTFPDEMDLDGLLPDSNPSLSKVTLPGELITSDPQFMRGHGTYTAHSQSSSSVISASLLGSVSRVNKLLSVTPIKSRYIPEIGDLVVGVITELQAKKWRVDINSKIDATLQLASINLPGGIQRRKTGSDELQMRSFFQEGDLIVAEVQSIYHDGSVSLHTRSLKYGKLRDGQFLKLHKSRTGGVLRTKTSTIQIGDVDLILGVNGYAFISMRSSSSLSSTSMTSEGNVHNNLSEAASLKIYSNLNSHISHSSRDQISRVRNVIEVLTREGIKIDVGLVKRAVNISMEYETGLVLELENGRSIASQVMFSYGDS